MPSHESKRHARRRLALLRRIGRGDRARAAWITNPPDIRYLAGCREGAGGLLLLPGGGAVLFTSPMFEHTIRAAAPGVEVCVPGRAAPRAAAARLKTDGVRGALAFQEDTMRVSVARAFRQAMRGRRLVELGRAVAEERAVKDEAELALIRRCVRIAEAAFRGLLAGGARSALGRTEKDLAADLEYRMRRLGADRQAFPANGIIVAAGPGAADCHHEPTDRKVRAGEPLLFDWGAELDGYRCDITRTVFPREVPPEWRACYADVLRAHREAAARLRAGARCRAVHQAAVDVLKSAGRGPMRHGLGHGIGLEVHEAPGLGARPGKGRDARLRKNMVVTVEPGVYLDGKGGIRIEDDYLVTAGGAQRLTRLPQTLARAVLP